MADEQDDTERTEDPTQKRLDEALERGDVVKSQEVNTWFVIAGATLILLAFSGSMSARHDRDAARLDRAMRTRFRSTGAACCSIMQKLGLETLAAVALPFAAAGARGDRRQHGPAPPGLVGRAAQAEALEDLARRRASSGCSRSSALANFVKGLVKLALIGAVMARAAVAGAPPARRPGRDRPGDRAAADARRCRSKLLGAVVAILAIVAAADYLFQYRQWYERQKMSLRETEGGVQADRRRSGDQGQDPADARRARMRKRMMAAVPKASVIITNPTHYAVALQYERGMNAPVCLAKGVDIIALQDPRGRGRARHPGGREPAARPRAARDRRDRPGNPARALQGGGRGDRLCDAAARRGAALRNRLNRQLPLARSARSDTLGR